MQKTVKHWFVAVGAVCAVIAVIFCAILWIVRSPFPQTSGVLSAKGLQADVEVLRDRYGVPHIRAQGMHDLYFAQGYVTAQDRFWQMDFWRHIGAGRLSEYFGKSSLGTDAYLRIVGFRRAAEQDYLAMDPDTRSVFEWYAEGVNAYISGRTPSALSLEYALLQLQGVKVAIEPWGPVDSFTWGEAMAQNLGGNMQREIYSLELIQELGLARTRDFFGTYRYTELPVIVSDSELPKKLLRGSASVGSTPGSVPRAASPIEMLINPPAEVGALPWGIPTGIFSSLGLGGGPGIGSNDWVISGSRTASGKPILANDPHLAIQMPSIWYETDLYCSASGAEPGKNAGGPFHVQGFTFAGVPGVVVGHNDRIAWGVTNVNPDVEDLYIEKVNPENPNQYEVNGKWVDMTLRQETIKVFKQDEPVQMLVRETRHGPVITDSSGFSGSRAFSLSPVGPFPKNLELHVLSLKWTALQLNRTFRSVLLIDKARNFNEFREALRSWDVPSQNFVYADVDGNIGYQTPGQIPIRARGNGSVPSPGWTDDFEWTGFIPFENLPFSYNPQKGYIVTANNPVTSPRYRYFISDDYSHGYRARRIAELIEGARGKIAVADVEAIQADTLNLSAREVMPYLKAIALDGDAARGRNVLSTWDMRMDAGSAGAAVYGYFWQALLEEVFRNKVAASLWSTDTMLEDNSRLMNTVAELLPDPTAPFWDNPNTLDVRETRDDVLARAMQAGMKAGIKRLGKRPAPLEVGHGAHGAVPQPDIRQVRHQRRWSGSSTAVPYPSAAACSRSSPPTGAPTSPSSTRDISSMRQIVDLADSRRVRGHERNGPERPRGSRALLGHDQALGSSCEYHPTTGTKRRCERAVDSGSVTARHGA